MKEKVVNVAIVAFIITTLLNFAVADDNLNSTEHQHYISKTYASAPASATHTAKNEDITGISLFITKINDGDNKAIIKKVIKGCEYSEETEISVINIGGTRVDEDGNVKLTFGRCNFPMIPGDRYLLFCEETEISDEMSKPQFRSFVGEWTYINLDNSNVLEISDETTIEEILSHSMATEDPYAAKYFLEMREEILNDYYIL